MWLIFLGLLMPLPAQAQVFDSTGRSIASFEGKILALTAPNPFAVDDRLKKNVEFWVQVYGVLTSSQGFIHDAKYSSHIYQVIHLPSDSRESSQVISTAKEHWKAVLLSLHQKQLTHEALTEDEAKVQKMFEDVNEPSKYLNAAHRKRMRFQLGQKDRFLEGLQQSGRYLSIMEEIFRKEGLPLQLTRLPFVESSFNIRARSKVGASGIWQFMRSTARLFIRVNDAVDERNDPIRATHAAAQLLRANYESLGSWPLAVTAYNHGRMGIMRAVRQVASVDLEEIVAEYRSRSFGFASSNFFTELLAAIEVERNSEKYFGKIKRHEVQAFVEFKVPDFVSFAVLRDALNIPMFLLKEFNPALTEAVLSERLLVPAGYVLRVPISSGLSAEATLKQVVDSYANILPTRKLKAQRG